MQNIQNESPTIELPDREGVKENLEAKLREYKERLEMHSTDEYIVTNSIYKIAIIEELLKNGKVKTWKLSRKLNRKHGCVDDAQFVSACHVIADYCRTGGRHVHGGTGFYKIN